jgi:uncharacterized protein YjbI with pentapeptide repeats
MTSCRYHQVCGLDAAENSSLRLCILHTTDSTKDQKAFDDALAQHVKNKGDDFRWFVFPGPYFLDRQLKFRDAKFNSAIFVEFAYFENVTFDGTTDFKDAIFKGTANFSNARFAGSADFFGTIFEKETSFGEATFHDKVSFFSTTFQKVVRFDSAHFLGPAMFHVANFEGGAHFRGTNFKGPNGAEFLGSSFLGPTVFSPAVFLDQDRREKLPIFSQTPVDFSDAIIVPSDAVTFNYADLRRCRLSGTDLRGLELSGVTWPRLKGRLAVYDEVELRSSLKRPPDQVFVPIPEIADLVAPVTIRSSPVATIEKARLFFGVERLYRQLKQNYEDRRDYERASDFHYGEKEMRRCNPQTALTLRCFLMLYWLLSGYGERYLRPLISAAILLIISTFFYLKLGLHFKTTTIPLSISTPLDWWRASHYSLRVMTLLKPDDFVPSENAQWVNTIQSIFGPVLFGLFALALRQRLKR